MKAPEFKKHIVPWHYGQSIEPYHTNSARALPVLKLADFYTAENAMKPENIEVQVGVHYWRNAAHIHEFAKNYGKWLHWQTACWHAPVPMTEAKTSKAPMDRLDRFIGACLAEWPLVRTVEGANEV